MNEQIFSLIFFFLFANFVALGFIFTHIVKSELRWGKMDERIKNNESELFQMKEQIAYMRHK